MKRSLKIFCAVFVLIILVFAVNFTQAGLPRQVKAGKKLTLNLSKFHFGSQEPTNSTMPRNLEFARPTWIFNWDYIESQKGKFDWSEADLEVKRLQKRTIRF